VQQTIKPSLLWDAEKRVFHAVEGLLGEAHEMNTLLPMVDSVRVKIRKLSRTVDSPRGTTCRALRIGKQIL
jgi:hypothetical protein